MFDNLTDVPQSEAFLNRTISALTRFRNHTKRDDLRSVAAMNLGLAYMQLATLQEKQSKTADAQHSIREAQALFRGLGWPDCSEANLKSVAQERLDRFHIHQNHGEERR